MLLGFTLRGQGAVLLQVTTAGYAVAFELNDKTINDILQSCEKNGVLEKFRITKNEVSVLLNDCCSYIEQIKSLNIPNGDKLVNDFYAEFNPKILNDSKTEILIKTSDFKDVCDKYRDRFIELIESNNDNLDETNSVSTDEPESSADKILGLKDNKNRSHDATVGSNTNVDTSWIEISISLIVLLLIAGCFAGCYCSIRTLKRKVKDVENRLSELKSNDKTSQPGNVQDCEGTKSSVPRSQATSYTNVSITSEKQPEKTSPVETQKASERKPNEPLSDARENKKEETNAVNHSLEKVQEAQPEKSQEVTSSTKKIFYINKTSGTETKFKVNNNRNKEEVFQLSVDSPEATNGEISLTEKDWDDTFRGRVISSYNIYFSSNFCDVVSRSLTPQNIIVTETGRARKIGEKEWEVISKLKITLE